MAEIIAVPYNAVRAVSLRRIRLRRGHAAAAPRRPRDPPVAEGVRAARRTDSPPRACRVEAGVAGDALADDVRGGDESREPDRRDSARDRRLGDQARLSTDRPSVWLSIRRRDPPERGAACRARSTGPGRPPSNPKTRPAAVRLAPQPTSSAQIVRDDPPSSMPRPAAHAGD